jgi:phasin family protein
LFSALLGGAATALLFRTPKILKEAFMFPFSQSNTPAVKNHLQAQLSFFNDLSKSIFSSFQQFNALNMQLAQTLMEETANTSQEIITSDKPTDAFSVAASHAQPAAEKVRAYQQHLARLTADTQAQLANVAEAHVPETSRAAKSMAEEVSRTASEETEKSLRTQQDLMQKFTDPFQHLAEGAKQQRQHMQSTMMRGSDSMQSASGQGSQQSAGMEGSIQGGSVQGSTSVQGKPGTPGRKE